MNQEQMQILLDHFRSPHHYGTLSPCTIQHKEGNPSCGDVIELFLHVEDDRIADVRFQGRGCTISMAATSMMTDQLIGKALKETLSWDKSAFLENLGIPISPIRRKCALLPLKTLKIAVLNHLGMTIPDDVRDF